MVDLMETGVERSRAGVVKWAAEVRPRLEFWAAKETAPNPEYHLDVCLAGELIRAISSLVRSMPRENLDQDLAARMRAMELLASPFPEPPATGDEQAAKEALLLATRS
jgi:hypothetical protein